MTEFRQERLKNSRCLISRLFLEIRKRFGQSVFGKCSFLIGFLQSRFVAGFVVDEPLCAIGGLINLVAQLFNFFASESISISLPVPL